MFPCETYIYVIICEKISAGFRSINLAKIVKTHFKNYVYTLFYLLSALFPKHFSVKYVQA